VLAQDTHCFVGPEEDRLSQGQEQAAVGGERDLPVFTVEQSGAQFYLQATHLIAESRLRDPQDLGGLREAECLSDSHVVLELAQFHKQIRFYIYR
jgi:hypothetical protein